MESIRQTKSASADEKEKQSQDHQYNFYTSLKHEDLKTQIFKVS